jgi:hypothetical protein
MSKLSGLLFAAATSVVVVTSLSSNALAWDHCGFGFHRNGWNHCVPNWGRTSGCPYGYHLGWRIHACVPN